MNSFTKVSAFTGTLFAVVLAFGAFFAMTDTAFAIGGDAGGSGGGSSQTGPGCCQSGGGGKNKPPTNNPPSNPPSNPKPAVCHYLNVSDSEVEKGDTVTLSWDTSRATSVNIDNGVGSVSDDGSKQVTITDDITYTLTARNSDGNDNCRVSIEVEEQYPNLSCDYFDSNKSYVEEDENFTLRWETTGATDVSINRGIGDVADDGSYTTDTDEDITYTLTARNNNGDEVTCQTSVRLEDEEDDDLVCELDISDSRIEEGDSVELEWDNEGDIDEILLEDDHGYVLVDTDDGDNYDVDNDDIRVKPTRDTEYTLTVYGKNGDKERCDVDVEVDEDDISVTSYRDQDPTVASIKLTNIPYTGFEAGPFLTGLFYTLLGLWGVAMAYLLVVKRGFAFTTTAPAVADGMTATEPVASITYPTNLPTVAEAEATEETADEGLEDTLADEGGAMIENRAHESRVLLSTDALNFLSAQEGTLTEKLALLDTVITNARASFPAEHGWIALNKERMLSVLG